MVAMDNNVWAYGDSRKWYVPHWVVRGVDCSVSWTDPPLGVDGGNQEATHEEAPYCHHQPAYSEQSIKYTL